MRSLTAPLAALNPGWDVVVVVVVVVCVRVCVSKFFHLFLSLSPIFPPSHIEHVL